MSRTLLYYPTFRIPSRQWLLDSVLYWDHIGSIVPMRLQRVVDTPDLSYLAGEGIYKPFNPEPTLGDGKVADGLAADFIKRLDSSRFKAELAKPGATEAWDVAFEKMDHQCLEALVERDLTYDRHRRTGWIRVKKLAAIVYMGLLADCLASQAPDLVQASTDQAGYEELIYRSAPETPSTCGLALSLRDILPCVAPDTELLDVVEFRRQRRDELLRLRNVVDELQIKLHKCESEQEAKHLLEQFRDQVEVGLDDIRRTMEENRLRVIVGSFRAIFSSKSPAWLAGAAGGIGGAMIGGLPAALLASTGGFVAGGAIEVAHFALEMRYKTRAAQEHPFSYLYSAGTSSII